MASSSPSSIVPGEHFDPLLVVKLALRPQDHTYETFDVVLKTLLSSSPHSTIYDRGLSVWGVGRVLQLKPLDDALDLKRRVLEKNGQVMDALVDIIGACKSSKKALLNAPPPSGGYLAAAAASSLSSLSGIPTELSPPSKNNKYGKKRKLPLPQPPSQTSQNSYMYPSSSDYDRISKNCSHLIVMLSSFMSKPSQDPRLFEPPETPLLRMAATPEQQARLDGGGAALSLEKQQAMLANKEASARKAAAGRGAPSSPSGGLGGSKGPAASDLEQPSSTSLSLLAGGGLSAGGVARPPSPGSPPNARLSPSLSSPTAFDAERAEGEEPEDDEDDGPKGKGVRMYFRKTDNSVPDLLLSEYMKAPVIHPEQLGPPPPKPKVPTYLADTLITGELTAIDGSKIVSLGRRPHDPRTTVLFHDEPAWDVPVPGVYPGEFFEKDSRLGYQVPRLFLPLDRPHTADHRPALPESRPRGVDAAKRPLTSEAIRKEYHAIEAKFALDEIRAMKPSETGWYSLPPRDEWKDRAFPPNAEPVWTPSKGSRGNSRGNTPGNTPGSPAVRMAKAGQQAWGTGSLPSSPVEHAKRYPDKAPPSPPTFDAELQDRGLLEDDIFIRGPPPLPDSPFSPNRRTQGLMQSSFVKVLVKKQLAGANDSYEARRVQRIRDMMSATTNFAFFPPNAASAPSKMDPRLGLSLSVTSESESFSSLADHAFGSNSFMPQKDIDEESLSYDQRPLDAAAAFGGNSVVFSLQESMTRSSSRMSPSRGRSTSPLKNASRSSPTRSVSPSAFVPRPVSPYELDAIKASAPTLLGTFVNAEDYSRLQLSTAQSKRAGKRADVASAEAKDEYRRRRLHAIVKADNKELVHEYDALSAIARKDHNSLMKILSNHQINLERHSISLQNKIDASIAVQHQALPLRFLFSVEGGAAYCRQRLYRAFAIWIRGFEKAQITVALAIWKMTVDEQQKGERTKVYRAQAGSRKLKVIMQEIDLRLYKRTMDRWRYVASYLIYMERDAAAIRIQTQIYRFRALREFLRRHDEKPVGGGFADVFLAPKRKDLMFEISPRVRTERRQYWAAALRIETSYRMKVLRARFFVLRSSAVKCQSCWRMWVDRKGYLELRENAIKIESMVRMIVKKWQFARLKIACCHAQRVFRGHHARLVFFDRLRKYRWRIEMKLSMPQRIQRAFRIFVATRRVRRKRAEKSRLFAAALRIQYSWYRHLGEFPRFLLLGCLRETDSLERVLEKNVKRRGRAAKARIIQRRFRAFLHNRNRAAALKVQCMARSASGAALVARLRQERWASRKLRHWVRVMLKKRHSAASNIAFAWFRAKTGRFLQHLVRLSRRADIAESLLCRLQRDRAASTIQAVVHGVWVRRFIFRTKASITVQKIVRGFVGRRRALRRLRQIQRAIASSYVLRLTREAEVCEVQRIKKLKRTSATAIQSLARMFRVRLRQHRIREDKRERNEAASFIQIRYRRMIRLKKARIKMLKVTRKLMNPFKHAVHASLIVDECFKVTDLLYNPTKLACGIGLASFCLRLGILHDVYPLLTSQNIATTQQLYALTEDQLIKIGIKEDVRGERRVGIFGAEDIRKKIAALAKSTERNNLFHDEFLLYNFRLLSPDPQTKSLEIRKIFEESYGARFATRAQNFAAGELLNSQLAGLQLRRYFQIHDTPAKAKERVSDLYRFDFATETQQWDIERIEKALDTLLYAAETLAVLLSRYPRVCRDLNAAITLVAGDIQKKARDNENGLGASMKLGHQKREKEGCDMLHAILLRIACFDEAAKRIQRASRGSMAAKVVKIAREQKFVVTVKEAYLFERNNNHVMDVWKEDRRKEAEEYARQYQEWLKAEEKAAIEWELKDLLRHGWTAEWKQNNQMNQDANEISDGWTVYRRVDKKWVRRELVEEVLEVEEKPVYSYEMYMASKVIQKRARICIARTLVKRIKRDRLRKEKEELEAKKWGEMQKQRKQHVTLTFKFNVVTPEAEIGDDFDPDCIVFDADDINNFQENEDNEEADGKSKSSRLDGPKYIYDEEDEEEDECLIEAGTLVDNDCDLVIGFPIQARFQGGDVYYPGTIFQINPTEYISPQGIKWYPKNTFGVIYDDGDYEPAVHRDLIRVMKLKEGTRVEAQYGGHAAFFPGTVMGLNTRGGKVLSYRIQYDDGTFEKAVKRCRIRVPDGVMAQNDKAIKALTERSVAMHKRQRLKREQQIKKWIKIQDLKDEYLDKYALCVGINMSWMEREEQLRHIFHVRAQGWLKEHNSFEIIKYHSSKEVLGDANAKPAKEKLDIVGMADAAQKLFDVTRPRIRCTTTLTYTKTPLPFGWIEKKNHRGDIMGYFHFKSGTSLPLNQRPEYSFKDDISCRRLQSAWRAMAGKRDFQTRLKNESILGVLKISVRESAKRAWIGYNHEGMTLELWLARLGLHSFYAGAVETYAKEMRKKGVGREHRAAAVGGYLKSGAKGSAGDRRASSRQSTVGSKGGRRGSSVGSAERGSRSALKTPGSASGRRTSSASGRSPGGDRRSSSAERPGSDKSRRISTSQGTGRRTSSGGIDSEDPHQPDLSHLNLGIFLRKCESDEWLTELGFKTQSDRALIKSMKKRQPVAENSFKFLNYYSNSDDLRSVRECVTDSQDIIYNLVLKKFKNNPQRVEKIVEEIIKSDFPITLAQITRFLDKYDGKPAGAQDNVVAELVNVRTTSSTSEEKDTFMILKSSIERVSVLLNNLGVVELTERLKEALKRANEVISKGAERELAFVKSENEAAAKAVLEEEVAKAGKSDSLTAGKSKDDHSPSKTAPESTGAKERISNTVSPPLVSVKNPRHSGHEAKASLILRRDAVQLVIDWWNSTLLMQTKFRGYRQRVKFLELLKRRFVATRKIQCAARRRLTRKIVKYLRAQQKSKWEQLWNEEDMVFYWFDKTTGEATWKEPNIPYRPIIRDRFTQQLMQAWPYLDRAPPEDPVAPPGICMICKEEDATRSCNDCVQKSSKVIWGNGRIHFCFICFAQYHAEKLELKKHTFSITRSPMAKPLMCCICAEYGTRRCLGIQLPSTVPERLTTIIQTSFNDAKQIEEDEFVDIVFTQLDLDEFFSREKMAAIYTDCKGKPKDRRTSSEIWKRFQEHLNSFAEECDENYCTPCYASTHGKGKRTKHAWSGYAANCPVCVQCEILPAEKFCLVCCDNLCSACAKETHLYGKKHKHPFEVVKEEITPEVHRTYCCTCEKRIGVADCQYCNKSVCDSCGQFDHPKVCQKKKELTGDGKEIECSVCKKPPDSMCKECGDVYCSVKWMGNPGCFKKMHAKGNRKGHTCIPYTYLADKKAQLEREEEERLKKEEDRLLKLEFDAQETAKRLALQKAKLDGRLKRLEEEAQAEFEERHSVRLLAKSKKGFKLPSLFFLKMKKEEEKGGGGVGHRK